MDQQNSPIYSFCAVHSCDLGGAPVMDEATFRMLEDLAGEDDPDLIEDLVHLFLEDSTERMAVVGAAMDSSDAEAIGAAAHALKSSGASIGALEFSAACSDLEHMVRSTDVSDFVALEALVTRATRLHGEVCQALGSMAS